jgi:vacuolar-type H+-ATPase subunit C/Vma6
MMPLGSIDNYGLLDELSGAEDIDSIAELLIKCRLWDFASVLREYRIDEGVESRHLVEAKLDGAYYNNLLNMSKGIKDGFVLTKAVGLIIDLTNLQIACRAVIEGLGLKVAECVIAGGYLLSAGVIRELLTLKLSDIPQRLEVIQYRLVAEEVTGSYNRTHSIASVGEIIDKYKFSLVKGMLSPRVLSPLVIAWYLILKELEVRNLRLILKAMFDNIPLGEIRQYLVLSS